MSATNVETIAVIGAGTMGGGIASVCLSAGFEVRLFDPNRQALDLAGKRIAKRLESDESAGSAENLDVHYQLEGAVEGCDLVIEAVPEKLDLKREVFGRCDSVAPPHAILATNTSELSVTAIAGATKRPAQVVGMHWFNPPERMRLIEMVRAVQTSKQTVQTVMAVAERCGKTTVLVKDRQGFVTTRALAALLTEAMRMLEEGVATKSDIDTAIKLGLNHPMGPLELADYVGLDTMLFIGESMTEALGERFRPPQTLRKMVEAGRLGRKSGAGFYDYGKRRD
ncbi:MAG TPA: 3-hydroxyacyl-CoA dehydrogenase family protein [Trueperaceae bacterium]